MARKLFAAWMISERLVARSASFVGLALLAASFLVWSGCESEPAPEPHYLCADCNVLLISFDTLRADHVGAYGYERDTTPNLDRFAEDAVVFEKAVAQSSWTRPAHMSIFTGRYPIEHGFVALRDNHRLSSRIPTLAEILKKAGYDTAAFVGGVNMSAEYGFDRGFDIYRTSGRYFRDNLEELRYWFDTRDDGKFFLFVHGYDAHTPYLTDPVDRKALGMPDSPPERSLRRTCEADGERSRIEPFVDEYDGAVHRGDRYVGKILDELDKRDLRSNTLVVILSDHGEEFLEHDRCFHLTTLYGEVLRVPLLIAGPGLVSERVGRTVEASVTIAATVARSVGILDHPFDVGSLLETQTNSEGDIVISETSRSAEKGRGRGHLRSVQQGSVKLIDWVTEERREVFNLDADPAEQDPIEWGTTDEGPDVAAGRGVQAHDALGSKLGARLDRWVAVHTPATSPKGEAADTGDVDEQLRALGYVD